MTTNVETGEYVQVGKELLVLVSDDLGGPANFKADQLTTRTWAVCWRTNSYARSGAGRCTVEKVPPLFAEPEGSSSQRSLQFSWELKPRLGFAYHTAFKDVENAVIAYSKEKCVAVKFQGETDARGAGCSGETPAQSSLLHP